MSTEPPRRRIRRTPQTRQIPPSAAAPHAVPIEVDDATVPAMPAAPEPVPNESLPPDTAALAHPVPPISEVLSDPERTWLPAGLALLVMVGLLVCAGLVLIAAGQS